MTSRSRRSSSMHRQTDISGQIPFERELTTDSIFAIQDEIATAIVSSLNTELGLGVEAGIRVPAFTESFDAYDLYLQARRLATIASVDNATRLVALLERVVELDPDFAEAQGMLAAWTTILPSWIQSLDGEPYHRRAIEIADHALALDPTNEGAHYGRFGGFFSLHQWESYREAFAEAERYHSGNIN